MHLDDYEWTAIEHLWAQVLELPMQHTVTTYIVSNTIRYEFSYTAHGLVTIAYRYIDPIFDIDFNVAKIMREHDLINGTKTFKYSYAINLAPRAPSFAILEVVARKILKIAHGNDYDAR